MSVEYRADGPAGRDGRQDYLQHLDGPLATGTPISHLLMSLMSVGGTAKALAELIFERFPLVLRQERGFQRSVSIFGEQPNYAGFRDDRLLQVIVNKRFEL